MRITNVEKFRNELYEAIRDTLEWTVEMPSAIFKSNFEYKATMTEYTHYRTIDGTPDGTPHAISLPHPIEIEDGKLYMVIGTEAVIFWKDEGDFYTYDGYCEFKLYRNKMSFTAALVLRIANKLNK